jgi:hypothetical protein
MRRPAWAKGGVRIAVGTAFAPQDLWVGVYWRMEKRPAEDEEGFAYAYVHQSHARLILWICPLPMCVLRVDLVAREPRGG